MSRKKSVPDKKINESAPTQEYAPDTAFRALAKEFGKLDPDKIEFFLAIKRYKALIDLKIESFYGKYQLSSGRFQILLLLRCAEKFSMSASTLAEKAGVSRASMTQFLDALEKEGYIQREDFPGDRRSTLIKLANKGVQVLNKKLLPSYFARSARMSNRCSKSEMKKFTEMYEKICKNIQSEDSD